MKELESRLNCWQMFPRVYFLLTYSFLWKYSYSFKIRDTLIIADYLDGSTTGFDIHHIEEKLFSFTATQGAHV